MTILALYILIPHIDAIEVDGPTQELINSICIESEDYDFCNKIIRKNLKTPTTNLKDLTYLIFLISIEYASDTYIFIGNIMRQRPGPEEWNHLDTCLAVYNQETNIFLNVRTEFFLDEYDRMIKDILSTTNILRRCRTDFPIPPNKNNPLIEKNRVMKILTTMSAVSGYMVINGDASLLSSVVTNLDVFQ
ncbi:hypothetical protein EUTSA_v10009592mg [Eutrema salsugineum]|uniref:Pectinesterase inhibitor domain-containing protein n=1 Tax=Eutrema salsugineum TaxID=72664 RepID=V4L826_EUTSA|nr:uncharacterized protein LOC18993939 [Eutrema salsugineum]ESQ35933.1 hypothetical protein EUTSA_v10009592mg [Eutrema salsugineum]